MSGYDDFQVTEIAHTPQDSRAQARLQDEANVEQAGRLVSWGKNNLNRFDDSGDNRVNMGELNAGIGITNDSEDLEMLAYMQDNFGSLKGRRNAISVGDLENHLQRQQKAFEQNELARHNQALLEQAQAGSRDLMKPLLATADGDPSGSLFRVLDTIRDRKPDDEISKRDLQRYMDDYQRRVRTGDNGSGQFNPQTRDYVENLLKNWDSPEVKRLRGTWKTSDDREVANGSITAKSLREAGALAGNQSVFAAFKNEELGPRRAVPTVTAAMAREVVQDNHVQQFEADPRAQDQTAREIEGQRIISSRTLSDWGRNNLMRYDVTGDNAINLTEVNQGIAATTDEESLAMLNQLRSDFGSTLASGGRIRQRDLDRSVTTAQTTFDSNEVARNNAAVEARRAAGSRDLIAPLMTTNNGHPNDSLYKVIDGIKGDVDDEIGKKDLKRFTEEYDWRSRNGDVGGHFTPQNRAYVQHLLDNWDSPEIVRLRGTYTVQDSSRGYYNGSNNTRQVANGHISGKSLRAAAGLSSTGDLYTLYRKGS